MTSAARVPGYPVWLDNCPGVAQWDYPPAKHIFARLVANSPGIESPTIDRLCEASAEAQLNLVMGMHERDGNTLYNTMIYISDQGALLGKHRKLIPTYTERLIWGRGDGSTLTVVDTSIGRVGGLVCWEHWMPLARQAMHDKRELIHAALWPSVHERHLMASRTYAFEGRCFVLAAGSILNPQHFPGDLDILNDIPDGGYWITGGSAIIAPDAQVLAGPVQDEETLLVAEIDPSLVTQESMTLDVSGHYSRPDVFKLVVNEEPRIGG